MKIFLQRKFPDLRYATFIYGLLLISHMTRGFDLMFIYSLRGNNISDAGAQALAEGLQHCSNLQMLE